MQNRHWIKQIPWLWASVSELEKARSVHCVDVWRTNYKTATVQILVDFIVYKQELLLKCRFTPLRQALLL